MMDAIVLIDSNYKEKLEDIRETIKQYAVVEMPDVPIEKDGQLGYYFAVPDISQTFWIDAGRIPEEMAKDALGNYEFKEINKEGYWSLSFLMKYSPADYFEGRLVEDDTFYIVYAEAVYICSVEERAKQQEENLPF